VTPTRPDATLHGGRPALSALTPRAAAPIP
jgi:hypothetical protein